MLLYFLEGLERCQYLLATSYSESPVCQDLNDSKPLEASLLGWPSAPPALAFHTGIYAIGALRSTITLYLGLLYYDQIQSLNLAW